MSLMRLIMLRGHLFSRTVFNCASFTKVLQKSTFRALFALDEVDSRLSSELAVAIYQRSHGNNKSTTLHCLYGLKKVSMSRYGQFVKMFMNGVGTNAFE